MGDEFSMLSITYKLLYSKFSGFAIILSWGIQSAKIPMLIGKTLFFIVKK